MLSAFLIDPSKLSQEKDLEHATTWILEWMIYNIQARLNPRWRLVSDQETCAVFWKQT